MDFQHLDRARRFRYLQRVVQFWGALQSSAPAQLASSSASLVHRYDRKMRGVRHYISTMGTRLPM
jgi:hypothetical protein